MAATSPETSRLISSASGAPSSSFALSLVCRVLLSELIHPSVATYEAGSFAQRRKGKTKRKRDKAAGSDSEESHLLRLFAFASLRLCGKFFRLKKKLLDSSELQNS